MSTRNLAKGFTLVELLVVISIIALLLSILMPSLQKAREGARQVVCRSNQKQIAMGALLWSEDNGGWSVAYCWPSDDEKIYPVGGGVPADQKTRFPTSICKYVNSKTALANKTTSNQVFTCPSARNNVKESFPWWGSSTLMELAKDPKRKEHFTYGVNAWMALAKGIGSGSKFISRTPGSAGDGSSGIFGPGDVYAYNRGSTKISAVRRPSETLYFGESAYLVIDDAFFNPLSPVSTAAKRGFVPGTVPLGPWQARWHEPGSQNFGYGWGNIAWVDGHVSKEPDDFDTRGTIGTGTSVHARWEYYTWAH